MPAAICLAASQTAARYDLPYIVDVGVADSIVSRGLKNTFRFGPGFGVIAKTALDNLVTINDAGRQAAKTVMIVHEDSAFGSGLAKLLNAQLPRRGFQVLETIPHPTPTRDFNNVVLKIRAQNPDIVIPANYYNEYVLLARTMQQQKVRPKGDLFGARRRGLVLQVRQGIPRGRASTSWTAITGSIRRIRRRWS